MIVHMPGRCERSDKFCELLYADEFCERESFVAETQSYLLVRTKYGYLEKSASY
jgi:hypothetical protein